MAFGRPLILLFQIKSVCLLQDVYVHGFHDCIQARNVALDRRRTLHEISKRPTTIGSLSSSSPSTSTSTACFGGICVGMTNGPHQGGNASYPVAWNGTHGTTVKSFMTVPELPLELDGVTHYLWTDVFFGDSAPNGRMNQLVPQLILGEALDGTTGPPNWTPTWTQHDTWTFAAHYFFEVFNRTSQNVQPHAAYGEFHSVDPGEELYTHFVLSTGSSSTSERGSEQVPAWILTMGVVGDDTRTSTLQVKQPYMGLGRNWSDGPTASWLEEPYHNMCINICWEIYGGIDSNHLPSSGAVYKMEIEQPDPSAGASASDEITKSASNRADSSMNKKGHDTYYNFTTWEKDEGNGRCPSCVIKERHTDDKQIVVVEISVIPEKVE